MNASVDFAGNERAEVVPASIAVTCDGAPAPALPDYLVDVYTWAYVAPNMVEILDREPVVAVILWMQQNKLMRAARDEIAVGDRVLQPAAVYGRLVADLAEKVGPEGEYHVSDIQQVQIDHVNRKIAHMPQSRTDICDARKTGDGLYDVVNSYFLMHEVPEDYKRDIANNLARHVKPGGKLMFVDYHEPVMWHPMRPIIWLVFKWLEPFAKALWTNELWEYVDDRDAFEWHKEKIFGGLYQKVVGVRKS
ncbi:rhodoquinone biosynthesis methyltransferase RquA [Tropicimonas sp. IMCC6043]|uniref:rhodoquinone biosynthesis methyltransferase RquA n=1 Tax=Tropicimonas sp. IMCC6043 TaxID=2510645 RepID=UPI00101CB844|nr:rhodoquinone biosynthesis methyltransferase RquA [Tropicimonas sp. IMCC6043]RYH12158.1 class I SAM-dependent methyltransferase [Tropicimonas sp. IMCC6043]